MPQAVAARVIRAGLAHGVLDDRASARLWAGHWARQGHAAAVIRAKLLQKGFDERVIHDAASALGGAAGDLARARSVAVPSAARATRRPADSARDGAASRECDRLARRLAARGFDSDVIERVVSERFGPLPTE